MSHFMRLSKINRLMKRAESNQQNLKLLYAPYFRRGYDSDPTVIGRYDWAKLTPPKMFTIEKETESFQSRNAARFPQLRDHYRTEMDQMLEFLKLKHTNQLKKTLQNIKGNNLDEKIFRTMEYDISSFLQLQGE